MKMPEGLEIQESLDSLNFIKSNSSESIKKKLKELPIEELVFDDMLCTSEINSWAVHVVLKLSKNFSSYEYYLKNQPELNLPDLPAKELTMLIVPRLIDALKKNCDSGRDVTPAIELELENLANNLNAGGYHRESIEIYKICKNQRYLSQEKREMMGFGIFFNLYRIAFLSRKQSDIDNALEATKNFPEPNIDEKTYKDIIKTLKENFK